MTGLYKLFPRVKVLGKYYAQQLAENETGKVDILLALYACETGFISRIRWI
jgi:hypothetical protein